MKVRTRKTQLQRLLNCRLPRPYRMTPQERFWLDVVPIGREFGSKDYERLEVLDMYFYGQISAQAVMGILDVDESGFAAMMKTNTEHRSVPELMEYWTRIGKAAMDQPRHRMLRLRSMTPNQNAMYSERDVRFAIWTEISQMVRQFFPETLVGFGDIERHDDCTWTVSLYMPESGTREIYGLGMLLSDPANALDSKTVNPRPGSF